MITSKCFPCVFCSVKGLIRERAGKKECHVYSLTSCSHHSTGGVWTEKQNDQPRAEHYFLLLLLFKFPCDLHSMLSYYEFYNEDQNVNRVSYYSHHMNTF